MPDQNIGQLTLLAAAQVDAAADRLCVWDNSAAGAARTKGMLFSQLLSWIGTNLGGKRHTRSATEPSTKGVGDTWEEMDGSGNLRYGWAWWWDGAQWRSPDLYFPATLIGAYDAIQPTIPVFKIYVKNVIAQIFVDAPQSASNYWTLQVESRAPNNEGTVLASTNTIATPSGQWAPLAFTANALIDTTQHTIIVVSSRVTGSAGTAYIGVQAAYNIVRV